MTEERFYSMKAQPPPPAPPYLMARLFVVTATKGAHCYEYRRITSPLLAGLPKGALFHGERVGDWVARVRSEGGGFCYRASVLEFDDYAEMRDAEWEHV